MMMMMMMMMMPSMADSNRRGHPDPKLISEVVGILGHVLRPPPEDDNEVQVQPRSTCLGAASVSVRRNPHQPAPTIP
jgi:hypothetical protein